VENKRNGSSLASMFFSIIRTVFLVCILGITIAGFLIGRFAPELPLESSLFYDDFKEMSYLTIFQIGLLSLFISAFFVLLISDYIIKKMPFLLRMILLNFLIITTISIFWLLFKWGPWIKSIFGLCIYYVCCIGAVSLIMLKIRFDDRKYNRLLSHYKKTHTNKYADNVCI
jgi:hypothetical protein